MHCSVVALLRMRQMGVYKHVHKFGMPSTTTKNGWGSRDQRLAAEPRWYCRGHVARLGLLQAHVRAGRLHTVIQRQWHHGSTRGIRLREDGAAPRVTPDPNLRVYASGNAAAEVSQVCWNANERGVYGRCRQQNSAQLWYVGGAGKAICCFSHDFSDDIFTDNWLYRESSNSTCVEKTYN